MPTHPPRKAKNPKPGKAGLVTRQPSLAQLASFTGAIAASRAVDDLVVTLTKELQTLAPASEVYVWLFQRETETLRAVHGTDSPLPKVSPADQGVSLAWQTKQAVRADGESPLGRELGGPLVLLPLLSGYRRSGLIAVCPDPGFSPEVADLLTSQLSMAFVATSELDQLMAGHYVVRSTEEKLQRLYQILEQFKGLNSTKTAFTRMPQLACDTLGFSSAAVYTKRDSVWITRAASADAAENELTKPAKPHLTDSALDEVERTRRAIVINQADGDPRLVSKAARKYFGHCALVPVTGENQPAAILLVARPPSEPEIEEMDLELLSLYGRICGNALQNIRLVERLELERQRSASIVEGTADGIIMLDGAGCIELFNPAMESLTGYQADAVFGKNAQEVFEPHNDEGKPDSVFTPSKQTDGVQRTVSVLTQNGSRRWVGLTAAPIGRKRTVLVMRDITEQYEFWQRQSEFVSIASHELRTPITALIGFLSLAKATEEDTQRDHFTTRAHAAATRLSELVEDLLSVARIEGGRLQLNVDTIATEPALQEVIDNLQHLAAQKDITLSYVNALSGPAPIRADRSKVMQVFANLVDNALKYTPSGGEVNITLQRHIDTVVITVTDTGIGIHQSNLDRVFDKFFREYTELSVSAGGTGLGLFITKELVERQGGTLALRSPQRKGTTATVTFPAADAG